ncbi:MAG: class I SAM-dependent methyltransferase [Mycolicibacterium sp.]|uniref:class I SAM-dependent methyltransferase n=1 Tax=Mycolicibacterium sp. TaxID=2320850 RepID=UPI003D0DD4A6
MTDFQQHYQQFYRRGNVDEWRRIGAVGKAANIVRGWAEVVGSPRRPHVIELGCGDGAIAQQLHELNYFSKYQGFDISDSGIQLACARNIPNASFTVAATSIPVEDDAADVVVMSHVIEHLEHPRQLIEEAHRIAPLLIVEVPCELNRRMPQEYDWNPVGHINHYNPASIRALLQTCRYDVAGQFTTNPCRQLQTFQQPGWKSTAKWAAKELALRTAPKLATTQFTYHETLMAWRNNRSFN